MRADKNLIPRSLAFFALAATVFGLQVIPITGIFLMFMLAAFWSVVLINVGFVSIAVEAGLGKISRLWLVVPVAWFAGYAAFATASHRALDALDAEVRAFNAGQKIAFDADQQVLVVEQGSEALQGFGLTRYRLPVVYERSTSKPSHRSRPDPLSYEPPPLAVHTAHRLGASAVCKTIAETLRSHQIYPTYPVAEKRGRGETLCTYALPEDPALPAVRVSSARKIEKGFLFDHTMTTLTVTGADGKVITLKAGYGAPYAWLPMFAMGCFLNSGGPSWKCEAGFLRGAQRGIGGEGTWGAASDTVLAAALGLASSSAAGRYDEIEAMGAPTLGDVVGRIEARSRAALDRVIAEPRTRIQASHLAGLEGRPDLLSARADAMVAAMERALEAGKGESETARAVQGLIATLPEDGFQRVGAHVVAAIERTRFARRGT